jgi:hypothetical protein
MPRSPVEGVSFCFDAALGLPYVGADAFFAGFFFGVSGLAGSDFASSNLSCTIN